MAGFEDAGWPWGAGRRTPGRALMAWSLALALACLPGLPAAAAAPTAAGKSEESLVQLAQAYDRDDCATVLRLGVPLVDARGGSGLPDVAEALAYEMTAHCELKKDSKAEAYAHAVRGTRLDNSSDWLWRLRFWLELDAKRDEAAVATIEAMSQGRGAALNSVRMGWIWRLHASLKEAGKNDLRRRLLAVLAADAYDPEELFIPADSFRLAYANLLMDGGDTEGARALVVRLANPSRLAEASLDSRLRAFLPGEVDLRAAAEAELALHKDAMARHPDQLAPMYEAAGNLRQLGRPQEALQLLQTAAARIDDPEAFTDRDQNLNWWWNALGGTYAMLGRYDEAIAAYGKGAAAAEGGGLNVSQVLNLAGLQLGFGRGQDALNTLAAFEGPKRDVSPYGEMVLRFNRACAHAMVGRPADAAADLAFVRAHEKDHPDALSSLLLCLGDMDGAAAAFISQLDDPDRRAAALLQLSDYDDPPVALPPHPVDSRLPALKARPDVKAAIERAGGTRRFRIQRGEL
jgi:tetratricopeptide (TPR) repeat protein